MAHSLSHKTPLNWVTSGMLLKMGSDLSEAIFNNDIIKLKCLNLITGFTFSTEMNIKWQEATVTSYLPK